MLSRVGEGKLRVVRGLLVVGWLLLIVSLFWDPVTPELTRADNLASPFHLQGKQVVVQGKVVPEEPYAMSNRIFWTMIIPLLPLTFLVVGHETWRRLCPLSFVSQIPRYLGWQRKRPSLDKKSGKVTRLLALPARDGWARRNVWYIQFFLLYLALNARILLVNSDRTALATFFIAVIVISMTIGYLWGGKTWCNYVCPINIVQKIYTEPRGILESSAHIERRAITQSMCRAPGKEGDKSICVGCTPSCGDIDLEKSHWDSVLDKGRRNVYYMFFGLVAGFYCFYYFYSGGWDYYFSGAWTHEADQLGQILGPGLYLGGQAIPIPKLVTSPLILGVFILASWGIGILLENAYRRLRTAIGKPLPEAEFMNQCLTFSAYVTINVFYLFGGRPNLSLLPTPAIRLVDILIVMLTTTWFLLAIQRTPLRYRREGLASSLLEQLRSIKVDVSRYLEGRKLEELKPDEVYVLAKTLPQFSREQKVEAYKNILQDALQRGKTNTAASLEMLREVRTELGVSDEDHRAVLEDLGATGDVPLDPDQAASQENWVRITAYRRAMELAVVSQVERGVHLAKVLELPEIQATIKENRELYRIAPSEHESVMAQITGGGGVLFERARALLEPMVLLSSLRLGLASLMARDDDSAALSRLLAKVLQQRILQLCNRQFSTLLTIGESSEARWLASNLASTLGADLDVALAEPVGAGSTSTWEDSLATDILVLLRGGKLASASPVPADLPPVIPYRRVMDQSMDLVGNLARLAEEPDPRLKALAITALSYLDVGRARQAASAIRQSEGDAPHWLLAEALTTVLGEGSKDRASQGYGAIQFTVASPNAPAATLAVAKPYITVGRDPSNDVVIAHPTVSPFHLAISIDRGEVQLRCVDPGAEAVVDGEALGSVSATLRPGVRVTLRSGGVPSPTLLVNWSFAGSEGFVVQRYDIVSRLVWLSGVRVFEGLELESLADIAETSEVRMYKQGAWLCRAGEPSSDAFVLQSGALDVFGRRDGHDVKLGAMSAGSIVGEIGVITGRPRAASVQIASGVARIVTINGDRVRRLMRNNPAVAMGMLVGVANYVGAPEGAPQKDRVGDPA